MPILFLTLLTLIANAAEENNFVADRESSLAKIMQEFKCGPSLVSSYMPEQGYASKMSVEYGSLKIIRDDIGQAARARVFWKGNFVCDIALEEHANFYIDSKEGKLLVETRRPTGIFLGAYSLKDSCAYLGWANVTSQQGEAERFLSGNNSCSVAHSYDCTDARALVQELLRLDLQGDRLKDVSEIDHSIDYEISAHKHYDYAVLVLDSKVEDCQKVRDGYLVTVKHEFYGKQYGKFNLATLEAMEKSPLKAEVMRLKIQKRNDEYRVNFDRGYPPHVSLKYLKESAKK